MKIICIDCGRKVSSENINLTSLTATCGHCGATFPMNNELSAENQEDSDTIELPKPKQITLTKTPTELVIERKWMSDSPRQWYFTFLILFVIFTVYFVTFYPDNLIHPILLIPLFLFAIFSYSFVCELLNKTTITIDPQKISIRHEPFPKRSEKVYDKRTVKSIYLRKDYPLYSMFQGNNHSIKGYDHYRFQFFIVFHDDTEQKFFFYNGPYRQGTFIEKELTKFLNSQNSYSGS